MNVIKYIESYKAEMNHLHTLRRSVAFHFILVSIYNADLFQTETSMI